MALQTSASWAVRPGRGDASKHGSKRAPEPKIQHVLVEALSKVRDRKAWRLLGPLSEKGLSWWKEGGKEGGGDRKGQIVGGQGEGGGGVVIQEGSVNMRWVADLEGRPEVWDDIGSSGDHATHSHQLANVRGVKIPNHALLPHIVELDLQH